MNNAAATPPQDQHDPFCQCGYRRSAHGELRWACSDFKRSTFFNELTIDEGWIKSEKQLKAARAKANKAARLRAALGGG